LGEVVYRSVVEIERARGALRYAHLPAEDAAIAFGVHGAIAAHYGAAEGTFEAHATTLDYVVAAAAGWLTGTFGGALEARNIPAGDGRLRSHAVGEIELEDKVLVIRRIRVSYELRIAADVDRAAISRAHDAHQPRCPVARSIGGCIDIATELHLVEDDAT
jgi:uncharacterized OsmC-like protein